MLSGTWSHATYRPIGYRTEAGHFASPPLGWILHVVQGNGSPWNYFEHLPKGSRKFSHLWVAKNGHVEEYQALEWKSWAQSAGNGTYWSVETEGYATEPLTDAQLDALAAWHVYSGTRDVVVNSPGGHGIGTHVMGGAAWGGHSCPGTIRAGQRVEILARAQRLRGQPSRTETRTAPPFPLPARQYYAVPERSRHNGFSSATDRVNIRHWQARMRERGWSLAADGLFGPVTNRVLRQFQAEKHLDVDGLLGPVSWGAAWTLPVT